MTRRFIVAGCSVLGLLLAGCAAQRARSGAARAIAPAAERPQGPVIVRLVGQNQEVTVTSGADGPLYSARTTDGQPIVANATLAELRRDHPAVFQFIEPAVATEASVRDVPAAGRLQKPSSRGAVSDRLMMRAEQ